MTCFRTLSCGKMSFSSVFQREMSVQGQIIIISLSCACHQVGTSSYVYADSSPLQGFAAWSQEAELNSTLSSTTNSSCVELLSTGTWGHVECEAAMFFICEFPKSKNRRGVRGRGVPASESS